MIAFRERLALRFADPDEEADFVAGYVTRNLAFIRAMLGLGGVLMVIFIAWDRSIDPVGWRDTMWIRLLVLSPAIWLAAALLFSRRALRFAEPIMAAAATIATGCVAAICAMLDGGMDFAGGGITLVILFVFSLLPMRMPWYLLFCAGTLATYFVAQALAATYRPAMPALNSIMLATALGLGGVSVWSRERSARVRYRTTRALETSRERIEQLLLAILPEVIVRRMQEGETLIADHHGEVSIVFCDLVGFTDMSRRVPPAELVHVLNRLFSRFDHAANEAGMQKIKTIGDAYMAVGGLLGPAPGGNPAACAVEFAFAMHRAAADLSDEFGSPLRLRAGVHVGPVVAGVIGTSRPAFDCWGEAVNLASRLESSGAPGVVMISEPAWAMLDGAYACDGAVELDLKGVGRTRVYRLTPTEAARSDQVAA